MKKLGFLFILALGLFSCEKDDVDDRDDDLIQNYLTENNISAIGTESGLFYVVEKEGVGDYVEFSDMVECEYRGYLLDGTVFDQTADGETAEFAVAGLISGFSEGLMHFKQGGEGKLIIPSRIGYGGRSQGSIPAYSVLVFDIKVVRSY